MPYGNVRGRLRHLFGPAERDRKGVHGAPLEAHARQKRLSLPEYKGRVTPHNMKAESLGHERRALMETANTDGTRSGWGGRRSGVKSHQGFGMAFRISEIKASRGKSPLVVIPSRTRTRCREGMTTVI